MPIFTDADRANLTEMRAITTNSQGQEVLVGLNLEETEFYIEYEGMSKSGDRDRCLELHEKHERARFAVLAAENQLRNDNPQRH